MRWQSVFSRRKAMATSIRNEYMPDRVSIPGKTLLETLTSLGMTQTELAERIGRTPKHISGIITGKERILPETAIQLERALGVPAGFWNNRQRDYDEFCARQAEKNRLIQYVRWASNFPYRRMMNLGWVPKEVAPLKRLESLLDYFGVSDPASWDSLWAGEKATYRRSAAVRADEYALAAWLRRGEIVSRSINCQPYSENKFKDILNNIRRLTTYPPDVFQKQVIDLCASAGVAVVFVPELPKTASGATQWLTPDKALMQLSLRYKSDDHLWFTFFHEAAHILLHSKKNIYIENPQMSGECENQANAFAENTLIPQREFRNFVSINKFTRDSILAFAKEVGIAPGIVVGRLQKESLLSWNTPLNELKLRLVWASANN
jgi:addiction module HigA family antidote